MIEFPEVFCLREEDFEKLTVKQRGMYAFIKEFEVVTPKIADYVTIEQMEAHFFKLLQE